MGEAIGQVLGNAVGVAISPVPIIALILILFSRAAGRNGLSFLAGWLFGLAAVAVAVLALGVESSGDDSGGPVKVVIGVAFLLLAVRQWRQRPPPGSEPELPGWMSAIDDLSAPKAFGIGVLLTGANPKNAGLMIAAAASISGTDLDTGLELVAVGVFIFLASLTLIVPIAGYFVAGPRAEPVLTTMKEWLIANSATVMTVLFTVLGAKLLGDGIALLG